ncbi:unnamed protein product [Linum trigynum]|uniref:Uncharacterized protein n=1 Tax=Linum trigynum TaxID=586398 RepID=A0AAV2EI60_9ROSI
MKQLRRGGNDEVGGKGDGERRQQGGGFRPLDLIGRWDRRRRGEVGAGEQRFSPLRSDTKLQQQQMWMGRCLLLSQRLFSFLFRGWHLALRRGPTLLSSIQVSAAVGSGLDDLR